MGQRPGRAIQRQAPSRADELKSAYGRHPLLELRDIFSRQDKLMEAELRTLEEIRMLNAQIAARAGVAVPAITVLPTPVEVPFPTVTPPEVITERAPPGVLKLGGYFYDERGISAQNPSPREIDVETLLRRRATSGFIISDSNIITVDFNKQDKLVTLNPTEKFSLSPLDPFSVSFMVLRATAPSATIRIFLV